MSYYDPDISETAYPMGEEVPCEHDWRVDPTVILASFPPQMRIVCIRCEEVRHRTSFVTAVPDPSDRTTWMRADLRT